MNTGELLKNQLDELYETLEGKTIQRDEIVKDIKGIEFEIAQTKDLIEYYYGRNIVKGSNLTLAPLPLENPSDEKKSYIKWRPKVIECLKNNNRLMTTGEILSYAMPELIKNDRRKYIANLSSVLTGMCAGDMLRKYEAYEGRGNLYGLPEMFHGNEPLEQYKPYDKPLML